MSQWLRQRTAATPAMLALWDDAATLRHALAFEAALAQAQAAAGAIPAAAAARIADACARIRIDPAQLAEEAALAGTLAIPLVTRLRAEVGAEWSGYVHRGATSQDVADTILCRQTGDSARLVLADAGRITAALEPLAIAHAETPAMGRTLLQDALPIGLGLRFAQWHAGVADGSRLLRSAAARGAALQLGGAVGDRKGLGPKADAVAAATAEALGLRAAAPWHARRTGMAEMAAAFGILIGAVGKMARDVSLLAQTGIGEVREPAIPGRGGSSAMAHKRNPTGCQVALAAAVRAPGLVATVLAGLPAEEERGLGGWQAEAPTFAELAAIASGAVDAMATVAEGLEIDTEALHRNLAGAADAPDIGESAALVRRLLNGE